MSLKTYAFGIVTQALTFGKEFCKFLFFRKMAEQGAELLIITPFLLPTLFPPASDGSYLLKILCSAIAEQDRS